MTGGRDADSFRWMFRSTWSDFDGLDVVTDFKPGQDHLEFAQAQFGFAGDAFDARIVAGSTRVDVTGADLVIYTGGTLDSASDVLDYVEQAKNGGGSDVFVAGANGEGHTVLYHVLAHAGVTDSVTAITELDGLKATQLTLTDFAFI